MSERSPLRRLAEEVRREQRAAPADPFGVKAPFLQPSEEDTRTWGNKTAFQINAAAAESVFQQSPQLIHVARRRPTTFTVRTQFTLGPQLWTGEIAANWRFVVVYLYGVGQASDAFETVLTPAALSNGLVFSDTQDLPLNALQVQVAAICSSVTNAGLHTLIASAFAAPVYA